MGEFLTIQGQSVKIGTGPDLYYITWPQLFRLALDGQATSSDGQPNIRALLFAEKGPARFRFCWPDEGISADDVGRPNTNPFRSWLFRSSVVIPMIHYSIDLHALPIVPIDKWNHPTFDKWHHLCNTPEPVSMRLLGSCFPMFTKGVSCPMSADAHAMSYPDHPYTYQTKLQSHGQAGPTWRFYELIQQTWLPGTNSLVSIVRCPFCGGSSWIEPERVAHIAEDMLGNQPAGDLQLKNCTIPEDQTTFALRQPGFNIYDHPSNTGNNGAVLRFIQWPEPGTQAFWKAITASRMLAGYYLNASQAKQKFDTHTATKN